MKTFLKVPREKGEKTRIFLSSKDLLDQTTRIQSDSSHVYLPLKNPKAKIPLAYPKVTRDSASLKKKPNSIIDALSGTLSKTQLSSLTKSFDIIGDVAVLEIPPSLQKYEGKIADAVMSVHPNVKCVCKKISAMQGEFRIRKVKVLAGRKDTQTLYRENGIPMLVDISKMYFSPRLGTERKRIASLIQKNEKILAFFSGCCPYPLVISRFQPKCRIIAMELNPDAHAFALKNLAMNHSNNITAILGDVRELVPARYKKFADRILMPLPKGAEEFLDTAFAGAKKGCTIHLYSFASKEEPYEKAIGAIRRQASLSKRKFKILNKKIVRPFSPRLVQSVIDFQVL